MILKTRQKNSDSFKRPAGFLQIPRLTEPKRFPARTLSGGDKRTIKPHIQEEDWSPGSRTGSNVQQSPEPPPLLRSSSCFNVRQRRSRRTTASRRGPPVPKTVWRVETQTDGDVSHMSSCLLNPSNTLKCLKRKGGGGIKRRLSHLREEGSTVQRWWGHRHGNRLPVEGGVRRRGRPSLAFLC